MKQVIRFTVVCLLAIILSTFLAIPADAAPKYRATYWFVSSDGVAVKICQHEGSLTDQVVQDHYFDLVDWLTDHDWLPEGLDSSPPRTRVKIYLNEPGGQGKPERTEIYSSRGGNIEDTILEGYVSNATPSKKYVEQVTSCLRGLEKIGLKD